MYLYEIDGGVVGVRDAVRVRDPRTGAFRNIPRQLEYVAWRRMNKKKKKQQTNINPTASGKVPVVWKHQQQQQQLCVFVIFSDIILTRFDVNMCAAGLHPVCADGVRPAGFVLESDHDLLSDLGFDYWTYGRQEKPPLPSSVFSW